MARWLLNKPSDFDDSPIATAGKLVLTSLPAIRDEIRLAAKAISGDDDLSDRGKSKKIAKTVVDQVGQFRQTQARVTKDLAEQRRKAQLRRKDYTAEVDVQSKFHIAAWLRSMTPAERGAVLREAASGKMAGSSEVMDVVLSSFPRLLGMHDEDPILSIVRDEYLARVAPTSVSELADIDLALDALNRAEVELADFGTEVAGQDFLDHWRSTRLASLGRS